MISALIFIIFSLTTAIFIWLRSKIKCKSIIVFLLITSSFVITICTEDFGFDVTAYNLAFEGKTDVGQSFLASYYIDALRDLSNYSPLISRFIIIALSLLSLFYVLRKRQLVYIFIMYANIQTFLWGAFKMQLTIPFVILYLFLLEKYCFTKSIYYYSASFVLLAICVGLHPNNIVLVLPLLLSSKLRELTFFALLSVFFAYSFFGGDLVYYISERYARYVLGVDYLVNPFYHRAIEIIINIIIVTFFILNPKLFKNKYKILIFSVFIFHISKIFLNVFEISSHLQGRALLPFYILEIFLIVRMNILNIYRIRYLFLLKSYFSIRAIVVLFGSFKYALKG